MSLENKTRILDKTFFYVIYRICSSCKCCIDKSSVQVYISTSVFSAIFLKKIGSGTHSDRKFGWRGGGISYIDARKKGSGMPFWLASI
jgi:hypothetical protein